MTVSISVVLSEAKDLMPFQPAHRRNRHEILRCAQDDNKGSSSDSIDSKRCAATSAKGCRGRRSRDTFRRHLWETREMARSEEGLKAQIMVDRQAAKPDST